MANDDGSLVAIPLQTGQVQWGKKTGQGCVVGWVPSEIVLRSLGVGARIS